MQVYLPGRNDHSTDFELQYRNYYLAADVRQTSIAIALWLLPVLFFAYMDYLLFGSSPIFLGLLAMRFAFCVFSLHTIHSMGKVTTVQSYEQSFLRWAALAIILVLTVNYTWVPYVPPNGIITILILFSSYMIFPNAFSVRIVPPLILSIGNLALQWRLTEPVGMFSLVTMLVALVMVNVLGIIFSSLLDKHRLAEFKARQEEKKVREELNRLATIDDLTGVYNRRKLIQIATEEFERSKSGNLPFSVLMIDLDHFKQLNDSYGHETGDRVLSAFAAYVASRIPDKAIWGRLGGEEFVLCLLDCPSVQAKHIAESIRQGLAIKSILPQSESVRFSISIGVTEARVQDKSFGDVLKRADKALYRAKRNGRNRTEVFQSSSRGTG